MKRRLSSLALFALFFSTFFAFSQEENKAEESYLEYFKLPRETLYLHTNKTTYLSKEDIWFKAYAFDRKNELTSKTTTNVYLGLYDSDGVQIDKKLYLGQNGAAAGNYTIDSLLPSGEYFLKVSTNWMKNFQEDDSYVQKIQIINPQLKGKNAKKISQKEYDFQFLPEGGHMVMDIKNSIGIKVINDEGKGTKCSGVILDSQGEEVARFRSNSLGIGKFTFSPQSGETYTAKVTLANSKEFEQALPEIKKLGIGIMVNNLRGDKTIITLSMNDESWNQYKDESFKLLLHKDGKVKPIPVAFDQKTKQIVIAKTDLYNGVNTVTLFNNKEQPILERLFFNHANALTNFDFYVSQRAIDEDTLAVALNTKIPLGENILDASISVLPSETKSYDPDHNIVSAILLKPYLKGVIENPRYYFKDFNRKKQFELDALLVTQGWSRYSWDRIFNLPPKPTFDFENGISINGFVNNNVEKISSILLYPTDWNKSTFLNVDAEGKFVIKNFYPQEGEFIRFSYMDKKGKMKRPQMNLSFIKFMGKDIVNTAGYKSFISFYQDKSTIPEQFIIDDSYEELDEIQLKTDYKKKLQKETRDPILLNGKVTRVTKELAIQFRTVIDFIQNNGYDVFYGDGVASRLGSVNIVARSRGGQSAPTIFLDNIILNNFDLLSTMNTTEVDRIIIDRQGIGLGISGNRGGFGGAIKIFTRKNALRLTGDAVTTNTTMYAQKADYGFQAIKEFYMPRYASYKMQSFRDYGVIHWEPLVTVKGGISNEFKMVDTNLDDISFFIEGVSTDGTVFSQVVKIESNSN
jgi:hypothetical protein